MSQKQGHLAADIGTLETALTSAKEALASDDSTDRSSDRGT